MCKNIKRGSTVLFTSGEYADYRVLGLVYLNEDIDINKLASEYLRINPEQEENVDFYKFRDWLIDEKHIGENVPYSEWHFGSLWNFDSFVDVGQPPI